uniref:Uncharacterized protein n=1 Tax=Podarcis muralis TaxID=64176 RepID=A0A670HRA3_PODMU
MTPVLVLCLGKTVRSGFAEVPPHKQKAQLSHCSFTQACGGDLAEVLRESQTLIELDLAWNEIEDKGVELLCEGLKHPDCKLEILELHGCGKTPAACENLCAALTTNQSLTRLHVSCDVLGASGKDQFRNALTCRSANTIFSVQYIFQ